MTNTWPTSMTGGQDRLMIKSGRPQMCAVTILTSCKPTMWTVGCAWRWRGRPPTGTGVSTRACRTASTGKGVSVLSIGNGARRPWRSVNAAGWDGRPQCCMSPYSSATPQPAGLFTVLPNKPLVCSSPAGLADPVQTSSQRSASTPASSAVLYLSTPKYKVDTMNALQVMRSMMRLCTSTGGVTSALRTTADASRSLGTTSSSLR